MGDHYVDTTLRWQDLVWSGRYQEAWDALLVFAWRDKPAITLSLLLWKFERVGAQAVGLKRCPVWAGRHQVATFIGNFLLPLSERLWAKSDPVSDDVLWGVAEALSRSKMEACQTAASKEDAKMRRKTSRLARADAQSRALSMEWQESFRSAANRVHKATNAGRRRP